MDSMLHGAIVQKAVKNLPEDFLPAHVPKKPHQTKAKMTNYSCRVSVSFLVLILNPPPWRFAMHPPTRQSRSGAMKHELTTPHPLV